MSAPNRNTLWAETLVAELSAGGLDAVCLAPGSRSTPLTVAFAESDVETFSHLDERSAAYFALGRARRTGEPTALVCTSGTAAANFHPAVIEANQARVPLLVLTADRPPELRDSGANQTIDQEKLYGDAVRWYRDLPEPEPTARKLRRLRTDAARALAETTGTPAGPVHLNVPFRKPLEPVEVEGDVPPDWDGGDRRASEGRDGPYVDVARDAPDGGPASDRAAAALASAERPLFVAGPADPALFGDGASPALFGDAGDGESGNDPTRVDRRRVETFRDALTDVAAALDAPILADPLSGVRFGAHVDSALVCGGYDAYVDERVTGDWPDPDVVVRFGASPTSKPLRKYLARTDARQFVVDPAGEWREAEFAASDLAVTEPDALVRAVRERVGAERVGGKRAGGEGSWAARWRDAESDYWSLVADFDGVYEGRTVATAVEDAPDPATVVVSNSMPVRDVDRFARPAVGDRAVFANRGASGIDGVVSTALGAGSATDEDLVLVIGDLAYYHDANGLLAVARCDVDVTIVLLNNDGGGIFHLLPIEEFDPPFTEQFETPHGLDFEPTADLHGLDYERVAPDDFPAAYRRALDGDGSTVVEVVHDSESSHRTRERLHDEVCESL